MAAAFAALLSLHNNLDLIQNHPLHSFTFELKQIQTLKETVSYLIDFMKGCHHSPVVRKEAAEALEGRIARAAEAAEDVVESHVIDQIRRGETRRSNMRSSRFLLDLQKVIEDMEYMRRKAMNLKSQNGTYAAASAAAATSSTSNKMTTTTTTTAMVGFDSVRLQLMDKLTGVPSSRQVIPIVGMGGIGKTFLARNAFNDKFIVEHFDVRVWATISQQYKVEKILTELVSGIRESKSKTFDESTSYRIVDQAPEEELHKSLSGRRYLIILDDMWSIEAWDTIRNFFPETHNGSRVVVTTRDSYVANHFSVEWRAMRFLNENDSWDLFCRKAFPEQGCPPELEEIGKKTVEKCKGLPLAIVVAGGHLRKSSMSLEYWENVANQMESVLNSAAEDEEKCFNVLSLSYSYLPPHLKPCFLLLGAFPEDEKIYWLDICKLWIAEGLIDATENTLLETVAHDYLLDLYERNLILVDALGFDGRIASFKLHDLLRELCINIGEKEEFLLVLGSPRTINRERRVMISGEVHAEENHLTKTFDAPIRFLAYDGGWPPSDLKLLRTLNKVVPESESASVSIFEQLNLRFLKVNLQNTSLRNFYLPSSISRLWNLQILKIDLKPNWSKVIAPYEIWEMLQLRHLQITSVSLLDPLPAGDKANELVLRNLKTLWAVDNFRLSEEVCRRIPCIQQLCLRYLNEANSYYCPQNLCYFHELDSFVGIFDLNFNWRDFALSLTFPSSIKWLALSGCRVNWEEMTRMAGSLPHLITLQLLKYSVIGSVWTTVEGKFPSLKCLRIWGCDELVHLNAESSHFPVLKQLDLKNLPNLHELPSDIGDIPTLGWIVMEDCSESSSISAVRILAEQQESGIEDFRVIVSLQGDEKTLASFNNQVQVQEEGLIKEIIYFLISEF